MKRGLRLQNGAEELEYPVSIRTGRYLGRYMLDVTSG